MQAASDSLAAELAAAASTALQRAQWGRAEQLAAGLLVLDPSDAAAATLADRARTGQKLRAKLARASKAARRG